MKVGDTLPTITFGISREMLVDYAHASGDQNPIHQNEEFAKSVGLPDVIAHGMLTMGLAASAVEQWLGRCDGIKEFGTRFVKPVVVPEGGTEVSFSGTVTSEVTPGEFTIEITATSQDVKVLGMCKATVRS